MPTFQSCPISNELTLALPNYQEQVENRLPYIDFPLNKSNIKCMILELKPT